MVENEINNNLVQEEKQQEKKTKKNKLYSTLAITIIAIGAGAGLGTYFSLHKHHNATTTLINLNNLTNNINGTEALMNDDTGQEALKVFIDNNSNYSDLESNVEITSWTAPTYVSEGKLNLKAKSNNKKYTGTITVTINALGQTDLTDLRNITWEIQGTENINITDAFNSFIETYSQLANNVTLSETNQNQPTWTKNGSFDITATADGKYSGTKTITINAIGQTNLDTIKNNLNLTVTSDTTVDTALQNFLDANTNYPDLTNNIEVKAGSFNTPGYITTGSYTITGIKDGKYTGEINVTVETIEQIDITQLGLNTNTAITYIDNMSTDEAWNAFVANNSNIIPNDLKDNVILTIEVPTDTNPGSLIITANTNSKYTGTITITIINSSTAREQILQIITDALNNNDNSAWINGWDDYYNFVIFNNINTFDLTLTNEDLASVETLKNILMTFTNQLKASIISELTKWKLIGYFNYNAITYSFDNIAVNTSEKIITATFNFITSRVNLDNSFSNISKSTPISIYYNK